MQTLLLRKHLRREGISVILVPSNVQLKPKFFNELKWVRAGFRFFWLMMQVIRYRRELKCIHLMANSGYSWWVVTTPVILVSYLLSVPVVLNYRGGRADSFFNKQPLLKTWILRWATKRVVASAYLEGVFKNLGVKVDVIPNTVDDTLFYPKPFIEQTFRFLVARNCEAIYGVETAIRAFHQLVERYPTSELYITGEGAESASLKELAASFNLEQRVYFTGRLSRKQMALLFRRANVLLNPSRVDNMPNALLEAQASGVAIIATRVGGVPFMVEHERTALLIAVDSAEELYVAMLRLVEDEALVKKLVQAGLEESQKNTWSSVRAKWLNVYAS